MSINITAIPALKDNYIWLLHHTPSNYAIIVDPGEARPVISQLTQKNLKLAAILITHHHWDHTQGIQEILQHQKAPVYGPAQESIDFCDHRLQDNDLIHFDLLDLSLSILEIPGHTKGHIAYYGTNSVFTGDTLFTGGCGRVFEGTPYQMHHSLSKIAELPPETYVFCGHEYTEQNLIFAKTVEPDNSKIDARIEKVRKLRAADKATVPSLLEEELQTNPFLRCHLPTIRQAVEQHCEKKLNTPTEVFTELRRWKDTFTAS